MSAAPISPATARAHSNIALIKYWGKRDAALNLPAVGSISITLDALANPEGLSVADRLEQAGAAGYDLSALTSQLAE